MIPRGLGLGAMWQISTTEIIITICIALIALFIFFITKEIYEITQHRGLKYFRHAFLFFAIANILKIVGIATRIFEQNTNIFSFPPTGKIIFFFISFCTAMSILLLAYSTSWKYIEKRLPGFIYILQLFAIILSMFSILLRIKTIIFATYIIILFTALIISYKKKSQGAISHLQIIYFLMFILWIINAIALALPGFIMPIISLPISMITLIILCIIAYKVKKVTHNNGKKKR